MKKIIFLLVIIASCFGCKKDNSYNYSPSLIGKWSWFISCGGVVGCLTPENEHVTINLVFTADSIYNLYQNDTLRLSTKFHTYKTISENNTTTTNIVKYDSGGQEEYSITHDTLSIGNYIIGSAYKRIK
jgi:hypothetical protein